MLQRFELGLKPATTCEIDEAFFNEFRGFHAAGISIDSSPMLAAANSKGLSNIVIVEIGVVPD